MMNRPGKKIAGILCCVLLASCSGGDSPAGFDAAEFEQKEIHIIGIDSYEDVKDVHIPDLVEHYEVFIDYAADDGGIYQDLYDAGFTEDIIYDTGADIVIDTGCVPNCLYKECGSNGCGGECGKCVKPYECINAKCTCIPDCSGKKCGGDGCGGSCPPGCQPGVPCAPEGKCMQTGACSPKNSLSCEADYDSYSGNTGMYGNSDLIDLYSCTEIPHHGPEFSFTFEPDQSGLVDIKLEGFWGGSPPDFINLFVLEEKGAGCYGTTCLAYGHETASFSAVKGKTYYIIIDASENDTAGFYITLDCKF